MTVGSEHKNDLNHYYCSKGGMSAVAIHSYYHGWQHLWGTLLFFFCFINLFFMFFNFHFFGPSFLFHLFLTEYFFSLSFYRCRIFFVWGRSVDMWRNVVMA